MSTVPHLPLPALLLCCCLNGCLATMTSAERLHCSVREELPAGALVCNLAEKLLGRPQPPPPGSPQHEQQQQPAQFLLLAGSAGGIGDARRRFNLDVATGHLTLAERLDRESIQHCRRRSRIACQLDLTATYRPAGPAGTADLRLIDLAVSVEDVNDNAPAFPTSARIQRLRLREHDRSARLRLPRAADLDAGRNGSVRYSFPAPPLPRQYELFVLDEEPIAESAGLVDEDGGDRTPVLRVVRAIDLATGADMTGLADGFSLTVQAWDEGEPALCGGNLTVLVSVENTNDFDPEFEPTSRVQSVSIRENASLNTLVHRARATDLDYAAGSHLSYNLRSAEPQLLPFRIDPASGEIRLRQRLDAEERQEFRFEVVVSDNHAPEPRTAAMSLTVKVEDVNDNPPSIEVISTTPSAGLSLPENHPPKLVALVRVTDRDRDSRHQPPPDCDLAGFHRRTDAFELTPEPALKTASSSSFGASGGGAGNVGSTLRLLLRSRRPLDREAAAEHRLQLDCVDSGGLRTESRFVVRVLDQNDSPPAFPLGAATDRFTFRLPENLPAGATFGRAEARDPDEKAETVYSMLPPCDRLIGVGQRNGSLYTLAPLDREANASLSCHLLATDAARPELTAVATVRIDIDDVNDCAPVFLQQSTKSDDADADNVRRFRVSEDAKPGFSLGQVVANDADAGENGRVSFALLPAATPEESTGAAAFRMTSAGELLLLGSLDRERRSRHRLRVIARDHGRPPLTAQTVVDILVDDVNDNAPNFVFPSSSDAAAAVVNVSIRERPGAGIARLSAIDPDAGENGSVDFRIVSGVGGASACQPGQFSLESDTGRLLLVRLPPSSAGPCVLSIEALDRGQPQLRSSSRLLINFTDIRPRGTSLLSGTPGGGGGGTIAGGDGVAGGARDLIVVTVCVAVSFLVLLCAVTLAAYFCYYMQLRRLPRNSAAAASGAIVDGFQGGVSDSAGTRSSAWLSRVSLGNASGGGHGSGGGSGKRLRRPTTGWLRGGIIGGDNGNCGLAGDSLLISHPMPIKSACEPMVAQESHYTVDRGTIARIASLDCAPEQRTGRSRGRNGPPGAGTLTGEYQVLTGASTRAAPTHIGESFSVDAKGGNLGYKSLVRPPSTEPTHRRGAAASAESSEELMAVTATAAQAATSLATSASMSLAAMQPQQQQQQQQQQMQQRTLGNSGYVYGSPYLTSSFV